LKFRKINSCLNAQKFVSIAGMLLKARYNNVWAWEIVSPNQARKYATERFAQLNSFLCVNVNQFSTVAFKNGCRKSS